MLYLSRSSYMFSVYSNGMRCSTSDWSFLDHSLACSRFFHQTCRRLRDASMARPVWLAFFNKLCSVHIVSRSVPARELEHHRGETRICWALSKIMTTHLSGDNFHLFERMANSAHLVERKRFIKRVKTTSLQLKTWSLAVDEIFFSTSSEWICCFCQQRIC